MPRALETATPLFAEKRVSLSAGAASRSAFRIAADAANLERVIGNLLENALDRTPAGGAVIVQTEDEPETLCLRVDDNGTVIAPEICQNFFGKLPANAAGLRLHFCRIVVENCGGEIGCAPLSGGGSRFWVRLTKATAA